MADRRLLYTAGYEVEGKRVTAAVLLVGDEPAAAPFVYLFAGEVSFQQAAEALLLDEKGKRHVLN